MSKLLVGVFSLALTACVSWNMASAADDNGGQQGKHKRPDPAAVFARLDTNGDGFLSLEEFTKARFVQKMDETKQKALFAKIDANGDGKISPEEFKTFMESHKGQHGKGKQQQQQQQQDPSK
jgi:hypothetical protein